MGGTSHERDGYGGGGMSNNKENYFTDQDADIVEKARRDKDTRVLFDRLTMSDVDAKLLCVATPSSPYLTEDRLYMCSNPRYSEFNL